MNLKDTYDKIAEDWVQDHDRDTWWQEGTDHFLSLLPAGSTVLDVGCGGGIKTRYIADRGYMATGIDFSEKMIEIAKRENPTLGFAVVDMYDIDTIGKTFDAIFVQAALLHIPKVRVPEVLGKMKDRLNTGGLLYVAVKSMRDNAVQEEMRTEDDYGYAYERFFSYFTLDELKRYFTDLGLDIVWDGGHDYGSDATNWLQIVGKKK